MDARSGSGCLLENEWRDAETGPVLDRQSMMQQLNFELDREFVELNQLLKLSGLCDSGGAGKALVASGAVSVDGVIEHRKTCKIRDGQVVRAGDAEIRVTAIHPA
jgi:ribosome-associated protein